MNTVNAILLQMKDTSSYLILSVYLEHDGHKPRLLNMPLIFLEYGLGLVPVSALGAQT